MCAHLSISPEMGQLGNEIFTTIESQCIISKIAEFRESTIQALFRKSQENTAKRVESG